MSEVIIITVDDREVDAALAKLRSAVAEVNNTLGVSAPSVSGGVKQASKQADGLLRQLGIIRNKSSALNIPRISRSTRYILSRIPGLQTALSLLHRIRVLETSTPTLAVLVGIVMTLQWIVNAQKAINRQQEETDRLIQSYTGLTLQQYEITKSPQDIYYRGKVI